MWFNPGFRGVRVVEASNLARHMESRASSEGPSGMTFEHLRLLLECAGASQSLHKFERHRRWRCVATFRCKNNRSSGIAQVEAAVAPFQCALKTRAGSGSAFSTFCRTAMLRGLLSIEDGEKVLPFVSMFHGSDQSSYGKMSCGCAQHRRRGANKEIP